MKRTDSQEKEVISRRQFLRKMAGIGLGVAGVAALGGCTPATQAPAAQAPAAGAPAAGEASATTAPAAAPAAGGEPVTLRLLAWGDPTEVQAREETNKAFEEKYPDIKIQFMHTPTDYLNKLNTMLAGGDVPDLIYIGNGDMWRYAQQGSLLPLNPMIDRDKFDTSDFVEAVYKLYDVDGVQYGFPADAPNQELFLNLNQFQDTGAALPSFDWADDKWNFQAFLESCQKLVQHDDSGKVTKYAFLVKAADFRAWWVWVKANGGEMFNADGTKCLLDEGPAVEAFQFLADLIHVHKVSPTVEAAADLGGGDMFLGGNLAMTTNFPALGRFRTSIKDWNWDVAPHPAGKAGKACAGGGTGTHIAKGSKYPDQAWTFLKWFSSPEAATIWTKVMGIVPPLKSVAKTDAFLSPGQPPEHLSVFTDGLPYLAADPRHPKFPQIVTVINQELDYLWGGQRTAQDVLTSAVKQANDILAQS